MRHGLKVLGLLAVAGCNPYQNLDGDFYLGPVNPKDFQAAKMVKDAFASGCGDFKLRSYEHNGEKKTNAEVRCSSYDIEVSDGGAPSVSTPAPAPAPRPAPRPAPAPAPADDEPPF